MLILTRNAYTTFSSKLTCFEYFASQMPILHEYVLNDPPSKFLKRQSIILPLAS